MVTYIYFVKCPNCEDEHFDFFDEAKEFAIGCLSQKPVITQTEVCRNDFGECTDSCDLGTVWSWEDMMNETEGGCTDAEPAISIFTKDDLKCLADDQDPEFDSLDNSLDTSIITEGEERLATNKRGDYLVSASSGHGYTVFNRSDVCLGGLNCDTDEEAIKRFNRGDLDESVRVPVPEGMTIEQLVEEMEENEDAVECTLCQDLFDKSECRKELNLGWLCKRCADDLAARGEGPVFKEDNYWDFLDEEVETKTWACYFDGNKIGTVEATDEDDANYKMQHKYPEYPYGRRKHDDCYWVELENVDADLTEASLTDIMTGVNREHGTNYTERDILDAEGIDDGEFFNDLETQNEITAEAQRRQRQKQIYAINKAKAEREAKQQQLKKEDLDPEELHDLGNEYDGGYPKEKPELSEIDEVSDSYLKLCPECGEETFDRETGICMTCGFN